MSLAIPRETRIEIPVKGMDCADCVRHVQHAIAELPGVQDVEVFLTGEKAVVTLDPDRVDLPAIRKAVADVGYSVPETASDAAQAVEASAATFTRAVLGLFGLVFVAVLFIVVIGEWLGLFEAITDRLPWPFWLAVVLVGGYPVFRNVIRATLQRRVIAHTLMAVGVLAALLVGEWATAAVVVFLMRVGDFAERFTAERSRRAVRDLTAMAPQTARIEVDGEERSVPIREVRPGMIVIVRPGEKIPVDGEVVDGHATVNQASITGESMPVDVEHGARVFAATIAQLGSLRVRTTHVGADTTFGRVIRLVEEAEAHRADVQRVADRFSAMYLPVVALIALLTFLIRRDPLSSAAVLVVACSCSFALATPIAMLASIGAAARRGLLIKGGKYIEALDRADVLLIDKTGTLTPGRPQVTDVIALDGFAPDELLALAASAERYSEHPLAEAIRGEARSRGLTVQTPVSFEAVPGQGIRAQLPDRLVEVGNTRLLPAADGNGAAAALEAQGKTVLYVAVNDRLAGAVAAADTLRPEVPAAIRTLRAEGIRHIELLTGDNERVARALAGMLGVDFRANLLPEDKIAVVKEYQARGHRVIMIGDGVNDAPALAQADVGIAMGAAGADVAIEAAHVALMREDWSLVPDVVRIARRTMRVVRMNIAFTVVYNTIGLTLAALGILPPVLAAAAQSLPDLGILGNSSRLLRQK
ncbi:MAG: cadmium-translocating P-type ATPase [Anaerolineae bacterium]|nr:cadmium-translocating P-type ATPase [Anaerolineae bacterium]